MPITPNEADIEDIEEEAEDGLRDVADSLLEVRDRLEDFATERPLAALGAALLIGIVIGRVLL